MNKRIELLCAHSILLFVAGLCLGFFVIAGWLPLLKPSLAAEEIVQHFQQNSYRIRFGMTIMGICAIFWWSFSAAIATQMKRIEGIHSPLTRIEMTCSTGTVMIILLEAWLFISLAYRNDIEPTTAQLANDFALLTFVGFYPPGLMQNIAIGSCILSDKSADKIYPRWVGYANFWIAIFWLPGAYIYFFHEGPFAWDGIFGFWIIAVSFFTWIAMMWWATVRAIKRAPETHAILEEAP